MRIARGMTAPSSLLMESFPWTAISPRCEDLLSLAGQYDAWLMSDDAHGIGVLGGGRGSSFSENSHIAVPLQMGTLSKAIGSYGGYLCASEPVIELMRNRARTLIYSTGLPPASVAAAIAAIDLIEREPAYAALPVAKAKAFTRRAGLAEAQSPIVPIVVGDEETALSASRTLEDEGFLVVAIRPPTVPAGTARFASHLPRSTRTMRSRGSPISSVTDCRPNRGRLFRHLDRYRYRQDLRDRRAHSVPA